MATVEDSNNPQSLPPPAPSLPQYPEMIMTAIEALNDANGSNKSAIAKYIESTYGDLPAAHSTLLSHHLNKMKESGELVLLKNNYMKPDPNAPPKRGRGRPPKPKVPLPPDAVVSPPRPRGRPPKPKDPFASLAPHPISPSVPKKKAAPSPSPTGRPRGRPPKKAKVSPPTPPPTSAPVTAGTGGATPRGRGRPPKVKPPVAAVGA